MLELPESKNIAIQLNEVIRGKVIQNVHANASEHKFAFYNGDPADYPKLLAGKNVGESTAVAGQVEIRAEDARLLFSDGVNIRIFAAGEKLPLKHQLHVEFDDYSSMVCTVQMYGFLSAFIDGENDNSYYLVAKEKPTPYSDAFNQAYFNELIGTNKKTLSVKAFLATEQRIPGLGNGVLQDILFHARIHPKRKMATLSDQEMNGLFHSVKKTLFEMAAGGGRDTEKDLFGCSGGYKTILSSKTLKSPCPVCGGDLKREAYLGGNIYFCPSCQKLD